MEPRLDAVVAQETRLDAVVAEEAAPDAVPACVAELRSEAHWTPR